MAKGFKIDNKNPPDIGECWVRRGMVRTVVGIEPRHGHGYDVKYCGPDGLPHWVWWATWREWVRKAAPFGSRQAEAELNHLSHRELTERAMKWLFGTMQCSLVMQEAADVSIGERVDVIGWSGCDSILVECKTSRTDFLQDAKKQSRINADSGPGKERWYFSVPGVIAAHEVPPMWGLAELTGGIVRKIVHAEPRQIYGLRSEIRILLNHNKAPRKSTLEQTENGEAKDGRRLDQD